MVRTRNQKRTHLLRPQGLQIVLVSLPFSASARSLYQRSLLHFILCQMALCQIMLYYR